MENFIFCGEKVVEKTSILIEISCFYRYLSYVKFLNYESNKQPKSYKVMIICQQSAKWYLQTLSAVRINFICDKVLSDNLVCDKT